MWEFGSQVISGSVYHCMCTVVQFFFGGGESPLGIKGACIPEEIYVLASFMST